MGRLGRCPASFLTPADVRFSVPGGRHPSIRRGPPAVRNHSFQADVAICFNNPLRAGTRFDVAHLPGVVYSEPFREVPVRLRFENRSKRVGLLGIAPGAQLRRLMDNRMSRSPCRRTGSCSGASWPRFWPSRLATGSCSRCRKVRAPSGRAWLRAPLMSLSMGAVRLYESAGAQPVDATQLSRLYSLLKRTPAVSGVAIREAAVRSFQDIALLPRLRHVACQQVLNTVGTQRSAAGTGK